MLYISDTATAWLHRRVVWWHVFSIYVIVRLRACKIHPRTRFEWSLHRDWRRQYKRERSQVML